MSLHLGNLSSRIRINELERVFQRFGRCSVRVKDRFGFVVYDVPGNAEKALRTLRGKRICGESISLSWSNRQPRPLQRTARGGRSYESHPRQNSARENHVSRKLGSDGRRDFGLGFEQPDADGIRFSSADFPKEKPNYDQDNHKGYVSEKDQNIKEGLADGGGRTKPIVLDSDRWEEQVGNLSNENDMENGLEFDRYEPYHGEGDEKKDKDERDHAVPQGGSPAVEDSQDKPRVIKSGEPAPNLLGTRKSKQSCYSCGDLGHKMRNCPRGKDTNRNKSRSSGIIGRIDTDHRRDDKMNGGGKGEYELKRDGSKAQGSQRPGKDDVIVRGRKSDRELSRSRKQRQDKSGNSPAENETNRTRANRHWQKKRRRENGSPERQHAKISRSHVLTLVHSDFAASKSKSKRSASRSNSPSRLRSRSFSSLSSSSTSQPTRSGKCKSGLRLRSQSRSRSRSTSTPCLSLSASVSRSLSSSPSKGQITGNPSAKAASLKFKGISFEQKQVVGTNRGSDNSELKSAMNALESGSATPLKLDEYVDKNHSQKRNDNNLVMSKDLTEEANILATELKEADPSRAPKSLWETEDPQICDLCTKNDESDVLRTHIVSSKGITSEEIHMALKHYGLQHPEESEKDLPPETYFGSARMWPWEIIYYRRLRKGPISTENYARRIAQNEEFGIVDKYVRSSSGWGEREEDAF